MKPLIKRLVILTAAVALPAMLLTGPIASPAQAGEPAPIDTYTLKVEGLKQLQASGGGSNPVLLIGRATGRLGCRSGRVEAAGSFDVPAVGHASGLEGREPCTGRLYLVGT